MDITTKDQLNGQWSILTERAAVARRELANIRLEEMELLIAHERITDCDLLENLLQYGEHEDAVMMRLQIVDGAGDEALPFYDEILAIKHDLSFIESGEPDEYDWTPIEYDAA